MHILVCILNFQVVSLPLQSMILDVPNIWAVINTLEDHGDLSDMILYE